MLQLALLTPRAPMEVGSGVCRLRETPEMKKKRLEHRSDRLRKRISLFYFYRPPCP